MSSRLLYHQWKCVANARPAAMALRDVSSGRSWTFGELFEEAECLPTAGNVVFLKEPGVPFVLETLRGWRDGALVCPVDRVAPPDGFFDGVPPEIAHAKPAPGSLATSEASLFTADQLAADAGQIVEAMGLRPDWPNLGMVSLAHSFGFSSLVLPLLLHGIPLIWLGDSLPGAVDEALTRFSAATLPAVPFLWRIWADAGILDARIQLAISAGAPLPLELEREVFQRAGLKLHNFYGARECGGIAYDATREPREDPGFLGELLPGVSATPMGELGLAVQSAAVAQTYWPTPREALPGGRFQVGDQVACRERSLFLKKPRTDVINAAGRKASPSAIERVLESAAGVEFAVVFGRETPRNTEFGDQIAACVQLAPGVEPDQIQPQIRGRVPRNELPQFWSTFRELTPERPDSKSREAWRIWLRKRFALRPPGKLL